ncbi:MAG TPA: hypothetical protein EYG74_03400 [Sulfurimonas autotrophica]|nr:hypothetical protein [Sulfurimonas autotrophica]
MRDIDALSRRCKIYRLKRMIKFILPLFLVIAIGLFGLKKLGSSKESSIQTKEQNSIYVEHVKIDKSSVEPVSKNNNKSLVVKKKHPKSSAVKIKSGVRVIQFIASSRGYYNNLAGEKKRFEKMGFSCYIKDDSDGFFKLRCLIPENFKQVEKMLKKRGIDFFLPTESKEFLKQLNLKKRVSNSTTPVLKKTSKKESKKEEVSHITSSLITTKKATIKELIDQYNDRPGFSRAIMIAKAYYNKKDFKNAAKWAKKANSIDREREEGWVLYAKSINALGQKERAVKILKIYLSFKSSEEVRKLLMQFERGMR